jgi:hypothetical protein
LNLALDISGKTGKPVSAVVNALGKSYDGNNKALGLLGLGYSKAELKAKSFATIQEELTKQYAGGANEKAATFEGTMARLAITFDELKEAAGTAFLPILQQLADAAIKVSDAFGKKGFAGAVEELKFQLQFLLYDQNGALNAAGETLNKIISVFNAVGGLVNKAGNQFKVPLKLANAIPGVDLNLPQYGKIGGFDKQVDINAMQRANRGVTASQGLGASAYIARNPGNVINVYPQLGTDPKILAREMQKILNSTSREDGGFGIRMGGPRK